MFLSTSFKPQSSQNDKTNPSLVYHLLLPFQFVSTRVALHIAKKVKVSVDIAAFGWFVNDQH